MKKNNNLNVIKLGKGNWIIESSETEIKELISICSKRDIEVIEKTTTQVLIPSYDTYCKLKSLNII